MYGNGALYKQNNSYLFLKVQYKHRQIFRKNKVVEDSPNVYLITNFKHDFTKKHQIYISYSIYIYIAIAIAIGQYKVFCVEIYSGTIVVKVCIAYNK